MQTVYIVDDDASIRRLLRRMLEPEGIVCHEFATAEAFLALLGNGASDPGCVLLDVQLPGLTGLDLLERMQERAAPHAVIMISGQGDIPTAVHAVKHGALDFVQKPFSKAELIETVRRALDSVSAVAERHAKLRSLTDREREVLVALQDGSQNKMVAYKLGLSTRTVEQHRANLMRKLGVRNLTQALEIAREGGLIK